MIDRQVTHLARLVDDLLDVSRISRGKVLLRKERLDLVPLVRTAVGDHRAVLEATGLRLVVDLPERPIWVEGDPTRLMQVVGNLLQNARKFTDAGGPVTVRLAAEPDGAAAVLASATRASAWTTEMLARLFEPFSQADRSLDRSRGGLGLGLALVKGLVELHGGSVRAQSAARAGLGADRPPADGRAGRAPAERPAGPIARAGRCACWSSRTTTTRPRACGCCCNFRASGGDRPTGRPAWRPPAAATGRGAVRHRPARRHGRLRRRPRAAADPQAAVLIALSGYGQEEDRRQSRQAGFDLHLTKPVDPAVLKRLLEALANGSGP